MMYKAVFLVLAVAVALSSQTAVNVSVYYESLCPDSVRFIRYQLYPTWRALGEEFMTVDFVPYGKATHEKNSDGVWSFRCQHGAPECAGNRAQACALDQFNNNQTKMNQYVFCAMAHDYSPSVGRSCATQIQQDYAPIQACIDGSRGDDLIVAYGNRTHSFQPTITFVPTVAFDDVYTTADQDGALFNLLSTVCDKIAGTKPPACPLSV